MVILPKYINNENKINIMNLYILLNEVSAQIGVFWFQIFPFLAILSGILVIVNKNPIISVLFLIGLFLNIAVILVMLGLNFLGLAYLLVYVGAISILFLFILMLISIKSSDLMAKTQNSIPLAFIVGILFISIFNNVGFTKSLTDFMILDYKVEKLINYNVYNFNNFIPLNDNNIKPFSLLDQTNLESSYHPVLNVTNWNWDTNIVYFSDIMSIGNIIYTNYSVWLVLTSLILLLAMVGAIVITIKPDNN